MAVDDVKKWIINTSQIIGAVFAVIIPLVTIYLTLHDGIEKNESNILTHQTAIDRQQLINNQIQTMQSEIKIMEKQIEDLEKNSELNAKALSELKTSVVKMQVIIEYLEGKK